MIPCVYLQVEFLPDGNAAYLRKDLYFVVLITVINLIRRC